MTASNIAGGSGFFLIGLLKKTLLADPLSAIVAAGFADPAHLTLFPAWQAAAAYSLRLYFDFSGYTDMAIGLAWMVGLRFPDNFDQPYRAASIIAYWQCWHMSLTRFLMTNVHAPLTLAIMRRRRDHLQPIDAAGQRTIAGFLAMIAAPIVVTMILVSLWHGATIPFLLFGLLHVLFLLINHAWRLAAEAGPAAGCKCRADLSLRSCRRPSCFGPPVPRMPPRCWPEWRDCTAPAQCEPDIRAAADVVWLVLLYAVVWLAPTTRQWMEGGDSLRLEALPPVGRGHGMRRDVGRARRRRQRRVPVFPILMRYLLALLMSACTSFALIWAWVVAMPMAFMDPEYPSWRAKDVMLDRCDLGEAVVLGDSRAAADILPSRLPFRTDEPCGWRWRGDRGIFGADSDARMSFAAQAGPSFARRRALHPAGPVLGTQRPLRVPIGSRHRGLAPGVPPDRRSLGL